jgi:methionyl aminopeptidase
MTRSKKDERTKSAGEIELMRTSSQMVARTLDLLGSMIEPGVTTGALDRAAEDFIRSGGGVPSFKGYRGFPASICASVNSEVVHGIPGSRALKEGDIISIDVGVLREGYHGDGAATFEVGEVGKETRHLLDTTRKALMAGIAKAVHGNMVRDVSGAIQETVEGAGYSVVTDYTGHGIGKSMHEEPHVPNFVVPGDKSVLMTGMTLAIEPMVNTGSGQVITKADGWTVVTKDGGLSAHFEHTVVVKEDRAEILTLS